MYALALLAASATMAAEIARLMGTEFGEVSEPVPVGDVGSSTMPQKRKAKLSGNSRAKPDNALVDAHALPHIKQIRCADRRRKDAGQSGPTAARTVAR